MPIGGKKRQRTGYEGDENEPDAYGALMSLLKKPEEEKTGLKMVKEQRKSTDSEVIEGIDLAEDINNSDNEEIEIDLDEDDDPKDPFELHFTKSIADDKFVRSNIKRPISFLNGDRSIETEVEPSIEKIKIKSMNDLKLKYRLETSFKKCINNDHLTETQIEFSQYLFNYQDILFPCENIQNESELKDLYTVHLLNHIYKTRDRVIRNNAKLANGSDQEYRDQGFTRPKVLLLTASRNLCHDFINRMTKISGLNQVENKKRFTDAFYEESEPPVTKPEDFRHIFKGNTNDLFCLGVKFTRQAVKLYSSFYTSDLIVASPLGLRLIIEKGDYDFLSSIEIAITDHADLMHMQTWDNVDKIFRHMNKIPKQDHNTDFDRVKNWYLDDHASLFRQTIILSQYMTPEMNSLYSRCENISGGIKIRPIFMEQKCAIANIGIRITQQFTRIDTNTPALDPDTRFKLFCSTILPNIMRSASPNGTLIFISSYLDFVRLRNYLDEHDYSFSGLCEYSSKSETAKARTQFATDRVSLLLYTERLHHFRRYSLKGVKQVVFYSLPDNPLYYKEVVRFLVRTNVEMDVGMNLLKSRALYSKWDNFKLERIVASTRVGQLIQGTSDNWEFE